MAELPSFLTPAQVAKHFGISERLLRYEARRLGYCYVIGKKMFLTEDNVRALLEAWRPEPRIAASTAVPQVSYQTARRLLLSRRKS